MDLLVRHKAEVASLCPGCHSIMVLSIHVVGLATAFRPHGSIKTSLALQEHPLCNLPHLCTRPVHVELSSR